MQCIVHFASALQWSLLKQLVHQSCDYGGYIHSDNHHANVILKVTFV